MHHLLTSDVRGRRYCTQVRINCVSPGIIKTPMFGEAGPPEGATATNLIPRPGVPSEVAKAIMFVTENEFCTGTTVDVDGGWLLS